MGWHATSTCILHEGVDVSYFFWSVAIVVTLAVPTDGLALPKNITRRSIANVTAMGRTSIQGYRPQYSSSFLGRDLQPAVATTLAGVYPQYAERIECRNTEELRCLR